MYDKYLATWKGPSRRSLPASIQDAISAYFCIIDHTADATDSHSPLLSAMTLYCYDEPASLDMESAPTARDVLPHLSLSTIYPEQIADPTSILSCSFNQPCPFQAVASLTSELHSLHTLQHQSPAVLTNSIYARSEDDFIVQTLSYIELHLTDNLREEDVAEQYHYSTAYFSRFFHQTIGISFRDYLCRKRLALAKRLLVEEPKTKIAVVAYQCGYHDLSYFNRIFKKKNGMSPGQYRQKMLHHHE